MNISSGDIHRLFSGRDESCLQKASNLHDLYDCVMITQRDIRISLPAFLRSGYAPGVFRNERAKAESCPGLSNSIAPPLSLASFQCCPAAILIPSPTPISHFPIDRYRKSLPRGFGVPENDWLQWLPIILYLLDNLWLYKH